jgi:NADPH:quinone reductase-like Zn-dependent oxidoreductase
MRAVLTTAHGERDRLQLVKDFPDPQPAPDEVLLRIAATAVNFHDIFTRRGMPGIRISLPVIVGSDIAGEIVAVGSRWRAHRNDRRDDPRWTGGAHRRTGGTAHRRPGGGVS